MPMNIVMSPFSYVAFELCIKLLENGQEVVGIEPSPSSLDKGEREEKELYLGRNANWILTSLEEFSLSSSGESILYVCDLHAYSPSVQDIVEEKRGDSCKLVYITTPDNRPLTDVRVRPKPDTWIHLPSVYGSWQPKGSFFERSLLGRNFPFEEYEKEDRQDILYMDDAIEVIQEIAEGQNGDWQVCSEVENHWYEVLKEVGYSIIYDTNEVQGRNHLECEQVHYAKTRIKPSQGIEELRRHMKNVMRERKLFPR